MEDYSQISIKPLTRRAINKLKKGGQIKISHGEVPVRMSRAKMEQLAKKLSKGKGAFLKMSPEEINLNGEGIFKSISRASKAVGKTVSRGVRKLATHAGDYLKSDQFKKDLVNVARPTVKGAVDASIGSLAASAIATNPELAPLIVPAAYVATYGANKLIDNPSIITGNKKYDKGSGLVRNRKMNPMGSDPITYTPINLKDKGEWDRRGQGIYAGQQRGQGIYAGGNLGLKMVGGRGELRDVLSSPDPLHSQHHNQMLRQFL